MSSDDLSADNLAPLNKRSSKESVTRKDGDSHEHRKSHEKKHKKDKKKDKKHKHKHKHKEKDKHKDKESKKRKESIPDNSEENLQVSDDLDMKSTSTEVKEVSNVSEDLKIEFDSSESKGDLKMLDDLKVQSTELELKELTHKKPNKISVEHNEALENIPIPEECSNIPLPCEDGPSIIPALKKGSLVGTQDNSCVNQTALSENDEHIKNSVSITIHGKEVKKIEDKQNNHLKTIKDDNLLLSIPMPKPKEISSGGVELKKTVCKSNTCITDIYDVSMIPQPTDAVPSVKRDEQVSEVTKTKEICKISTNQTSLQSTLRESLLKEVQKDNQDMPQSIVDNMFKDFLASKMQQIEEEYKKMSKNFTGGMTEEDAMDISRSVDEMNKLLDEELDSISNSTMTKCDDTKSKSKAGSASKVSGKMQLQFKISKESAEIISSGQQFDKEGNKKKVLEEGEVSSDVDDDTASGDDDSDSPEDDENDEDDEVSGTGSLSDSDKDSKRKKKKKKAKKKKSKRKKHKSIKDKGRESDGRISNSKRKRSRSRSKSPKRYRRSRSSDRRRRTRSRSTERHNKSSYYLYDAYDYRDRKKDRYYGSDYVKEKERGYSRDKWSRRDKEKKSRSRSRSRSKSKERPFRVSDLRLKIDKAKLREIAIKNALALAKSGHVQNVDLAAIKSGGKSINELTDFCKRISSRDLSKREVTSDDDGEANKEKQSDEEEFINHPFKVKDVSNIIMNIRDSKPLPIQTPQEKIMQQASLRLTFPVSSGSTHRLKESEWVPVVKTTATATKPVATTTASNINTSTTTAPTSSTITVPTSIASVSTDVPPNPVKPEDKVFPDPPQQPLDITAIISERLSAFKQLKQNPQDLDAMKNIARAQEKASLWAQSKNLPGKFIGSTGAQILSQDELMGPDKRRQAWAKKDQFVNAAPVKSGIGMALLQKMGWRQGEGLGKNKEGGLEPLALDFKTDRKGLTSQGEHTKKAGSFAGGGAGKGPPIKDLSGKHPVSALVELCNRRKWGAPDFQLLHEGGPDHKKTFLFKVVVNGVSYQPSIASNNKKLAKAAAATVCLQELGLVPR